MPLALLLAPVMLLASCLEVVDDGSEAMGYLSPVSVSFDVSIEDMPETKALSLPSIETPSEDQILFVVKDKNGNELHSGYGMWDGSLIIPVGNYTVEASFGTNGFGEPYFYGSVSGYLDPYENEQVQSITLKVSNSLAVVNMDSELSSHFTPSSLILVSAGMSCEAILGEYCFVPSGGILSVILDGSNSMGNKTSFSYKLPSPAPGSAYEVICGKASTNWPSLSLSADKVVAWATRIYITSSADFGGDISAENKAAVVYEAIPASSMDWSQAKTAEMDNGVPVIKELAAGTEYKVRARAGVLVSSELRVTPQFSGLTTSAAHTFTSNLLDGTDVTVSFTHASSAVKSSIKSWALNLCKGDGTVLRSGLAIGTLSDGSKITSADGWPYLPADSGETYKIRASVTMSDGEVITTEVSCSVPTTPDFSVSMKSYTSYDKYAGTNGITKNLTEANNSCDPSTIYDVGASWGISLNLMKNTNYLKTLLITDNNAELKKYEVTSFEANSFYESVSGREWRAHELKASVTIAGKTCSKTQTHHVTGLPYRPTSMVEADWTLASWNCEYSGGMIQLGGVSGSGEASATSNMKFHIPASIGVKLNTNVTVRAYKFALWYNTDFTVAVNGTTIIKQNSDKQDNNNTGKNYNLSATSTFTTSGSSVKLKSSYTAAGPWSKVYSLEILYN